MEVQFHLVCLVCFLGAAPGHIEHSMVRFAVEPSLVVHDITEATDEEIGNILGRAFGGSA